MWVVLKSFPSKMQRFHPGDEVRPSDCNSHDHFENLKAQGYIGEAPAKADPAKAEAPVVPATGTAAGVATAEGAAAAEGVPATEGVAAAPAEPATPAA